MKRNMHAADRIVRAVLAAAAVWLAIAVGAGNRRRSDRPGLRGDHGGHGHQRVLPAVPAARPLSGRRKLA